MDFYNNVLFLCNEHGISAAAMCKELHIGKSQLGRWQDGAKPQTATAKKIAEYFGVTINSLFNDNYSTGTKKEQATQTDNLSVEQMTKELLSYIATTDDEETIRVVYSVLNKMKK